VPIASQFRIKKKLLLLPPYMDLENNSLVKHKTCDFVPEVSVLSLVGGAACPGSVFPHSTPDSSYYGRFFLHTFNFCTRYSTYLLSCITIFTVDLASFKNTQI
jgi:hypothetical protein